MPTKCARDGCNNLPRQNSKYCSRYCSNKVYRDKHNQHTHYSCCYPDQRGAIVYDPQCASPYRMSKTDARAHLELHSFLPGTVLLMDGERITI